MVWFCSTVPLQDVDSLVTALTIYNKDLVYTLWVFKRNSFPLKFAIRMQHASLQSMLQ